MSKIYEASSSPGEPPLMLIFPEGHWESLPFEIRLLHPWFGSEFRDRASVSRSQRMEIATRGYCIAPAVNTEVSPDLAQSTWSKKRPGP